MPFVVDGEILIEHTKEGVLRHVVPIDWESTIAEFRRNHNVKKLSLEFLRRFRNRVLRSLSKGEGMGNPCGGSCS